jgi:hypothetical protein
MHAPWHPSSGLLYPSLVSCILYPVSYFQSPDPVSPVLHLVSFHESSMLSFILYLHTVACILQPALLTCIMNPVLACCRVSFTYIPHLVLCILFQISFTYVRESVSCILYPICCCISRSASYIFCIVSCILRSQKCILYFLNITK